MIVTYFRDHKNMSSYEVKFNVSSHDNYDNVSYVLVFLSSAMRSVVRQITNQDAADKDEKVDEDLVYA